MIRFQHLYYLLGLAVLPLLLVLYISVVYWKQKKIKKLGDERLISDQLLGFIRGRTTLKFILLAFALGAMIIGWANLQSGDKPEKVERKGIDVVIALDVSKSMLAKDVAPDRLTRAKQLIMLMTEKMQNDRVAFIVFAGRAYMQLPLTVDYNAMKMMLQNASPDMVPTQGTVIGEAIDMAMKSFTDNVHKYKSIIIISDGEDHDENAIQKTKEAADAGVVVNTVGIGSPQGVTLYDPDTKSVKLDETGNPVVSKLNEENLRAIASAGHGSYMLLQNPDDAAQKLITGIEGMEQKKLGSMEFSEFTSYFQYFLLAGFIALLIEWFLPGARFKKKISAKNVVATIIAFLLLTWSATLSAQTNQLIQKGNQFYDQQNFMDAAKNYQQALKKDPNNAAGLFNLGNSLYQMNQKNPSQQTTLLDSSRKYMSMAAGKSKDKMSKSAANYNVGNTYMSQQKWQDAIDAYKNTLRNNPNDVDAKYNLSYAQEKMKQQNKDNKDQKQQNQKQQDQKKDQQKNQQKDGKDKDKDQQQQQQSKPGEPKDKDDKDQQQPQQMPSKLTQQQADQLLNALQNEEKKLQDKLQKKKGVPTKLEKDW